jgi:hypothetical protein
VKPAAKRIEDENEYEEEEEKADILAVLSISYIWYETSGNDE